MKSGEWWVEFEGGVWMGRRSGTDNVSNLNLEGAGWVGKGILNDMIACDMKALKAKKMVTLYLDCDCDER